MSGSYNLAGAPRAIRQIGQASSAGPMDSVATSAVVGWWRRGAVGIVPWILVDDMGNPDATTEWTLAQRTVSWIKGRIRLIMR